ncbi:MAG: hypothetical protein J5501_06345 [Ruminococcus sp.]|nr:hypothetical protein [Ruminococcus sp.]
MGKRITSIAVAGAMLMPLCGCASETADTSSVSGSVSVSSDGRTVYETAFYRFTTDSGLKLTESNDYDDDDIADKFEFEGSGIISLEISGSSVQRLRAKASAEDYAESLRDDENITDIETEVIEEAPYECAACHYTNNDNEKSVGQCISSYYMTYQSMELAVFAHYKKSDAKSARAELRKIMCSAEYISDIFLPTEPQDYDTPYFTLHYDPKWGVARDTETDLTTGNVVGVKFCYAETDDPGKYLTPSLSFAVLNNGGNDTAAEKAQSVYESKQKSKTTNDIELSTVDFMGNEAQLLTYRISTGDIRWGIRAWYFDLNGMIYTVTSVINDGSEDDQKEIDELLSGLTLKHLTEEKIAEQHQAREDARTTDETFRNASFIMDSRMIRSSLESEQRVGFFNYTRNLEITVHDLILSPEELAENTAESRRHLAEINPDSTPDDWDIKLSDETVSGYDMVLLSYIEPENASHSYDEHFRIYYLGRGEETWEFEFSNSPDNEEEMTEFITKFFESLKFDQ